MRTAKMIAAYGTALTIELAAWFLILGSIVARFSPNEPPKWLTYGTAIPGTIVLVLTGNALDRAFGRTPKDPIGDLFSGEEEE